MIKMITKEEFEKAVEVCTNGDMNCTQCPLGKRFYKCGVYFTRYIKENEPAPTAIGTSSGVSDDTCSILQFDDSTKKAICQEVENARCRLVQAYDEDLESNLGIRLLRLYGETMRLLEAMTHRLKGGSGDEH